uniref:Protein MMS22-like N-terminal domain-containing protein n=1 Tax=Parascaris univalens TaxID=6257 RepID=A0A914ZG78_PARUN
MPLLKDTQVDLFASESELPEWRCSEWSCANRNSTRIADYCSLPSVQYSLPPFIKLSTCRISFHLLNDEKGNAMVFGCLRMLFSRIMNGATETLMVDLDRCLCYISMAAKNMQLAGKSCTVALIARYFRAFLVQIGTIRRYVLNSHSFTTRSIETNYPAHATLMVWMTAFRIFDLLKDSAVDFELLYPIGDSNASEQAATLIAYGLLTTAKVTERPFMCKCACFAWQQLHSCMSDAFWRMFSWLFRLCVGAVTFNYPTNPSSVMFLELCEARDSISSETFSDVLCSLDWRPANLRLLPGKATNSCLECLRQILLKTADHRNALIRLYTFFGSRNAEELTGAESILQHYFNVLCARIMEPSPMSTLCELSRESGKAWLEAMKGHCVDVELREDLNEWDIFIRVATVVCSKCESVWRSFKPRIFSKFTPKRFREMPISSLIEMLTLFLAFAYSTDTREVCEKTSMLIMSIFESSGKDRQEVLLRAVHCQILMHAERGLDDASIIKSLISLTDKLNEADSSDIYAESYLFAAQKGLELSSLHRFLPRMSSADITRILEASTHFTTVSACLWKVAVERLLMSDASHSIVFLTTQLRHRCVDNPMLASQRMALITSVLLSEKAPWTNTAFEFLIEFIQSLDGEIRFPIESILPLWFAVVLTHIESDGLTDVSQFICTGFRSFAQDKGFPSKEFSSDISSTDAAVRWIFESVSEIARRNEMWAREAMLRWLEPVACVLQKVLLKSTMEVCTQSCRIASYIFRFASRLIYRSAGECNFNQSLFVRLCKLYIQNTLIVRNFEATFLDESVPNYFCGLLMLPIASSSYLQRIAVDIIEKFSLDYSLKQKMKRLLGDHPRFIPILYAACKADSNAFKFLTAIA